MSDEVLQQITRIVEAALRLPEAERAAYVDDACGDDAELRLQVEIALGRVEEPGGATGPTGEDFQSLLDAVAAGDGDAANRFWEIVWEDLRGFARHVLRGFDDRPDVPQTTSLVIRTYERLTKCSRFPAKNKRYFLGAARTAMVRIVIEILRVRKPTASLNGMIGRIEEMVPIPDLDIERLVTLLDRLGSDHARSADVIRLRVLNGLSVHEAATALEVCDRTIEKDTKFALVWLSDRMGG